MTIAPLLTSVGAVHERSGAERARRRRSATAATAATAGGWRRGVIKGAGLVASERKGLGSTNTGRVALAVLRTPPPPSTPDDPLLLHLQAAETMRDWYILFLLRAVIGGDSLLLPLEWNNRVVTR